MIDDPPTVCSMSSASQEQRSTGRVVPLYYPSEQWLGSHERRVCNVHTPVVQWRTNVGYGHHPLAPIIAARTIKRAFTSTATVASSEGSVIQ
jgi:hypothetical protein